MLSWVDPISSSRSVSVWRFWGEINFAGVVEGENPEIQWPIVEMVSLVSLLHTWFDIFIPSYYISYYYTEYGVYRDFSRN
jgi:hypothetical protein